MPTEPDLNRTLTDENVRKAAVSCLAGACESLGTVVTDDTIRNHLNASLAKRDIYSLNLAINKVLQADLPRRVQGGRWHIAIDLHDQPYYGHSTAVDKWVCRSQRKAGTGRFLRIATAFVMHDGLRYTVAMKIVGPGQRLEDVVAWLIQSVRRAGIGVRRYWLDRGFASGAVVARLEAMRVSAIIACPVRGKTGATLGLSLDGGFDELCEFVPSRAFNSASCCFRFSPRLTATVTSLFKVALTARRSAF